MRALFARLLLGIVAWVATSDLRAQENRQVWAATISGGWITYSSPALSRNGDTVYVGFERTSSGGVIAFPTSGGSARWVRVFSGPVDSSPMIGPDGTIYIGSVNGTLYALNPVNGASRWEYIAGGFISSTPALAPDGSIVFGDGSGQIIAVGSNGVERWRYATSDRIFSSPAIAGDGTIYCGSNDRYLYALNPDGSLKWRFLTGGAILGSPAIGWDGTVYIGSVDQTLYALTPGGAVKWRFFTNGVIDASPVLGADGTVYFASGDTYFYALDPVAPDAQRITWRTDMGVTAASSAAVRADGVIIVGADDGRIRAFHPDDGRVLWTFRAQEDIQSSPAIATDGAIYFGSLDGRLYRLEGNGSPASAVSSWPTFQRDIHRTGQLPGAQVSRLVNLSARVSAQANDTLFAGFYVQGGNGHPFLMRAVGPGLAQFGIGEFMPDPRLDLYTADQRLFQSNDNWSEQIPGFSVADAVQGLAAFELPPGSKDAAMVPSLRAGAWTAQVTSTDRRGGVVLVEAYDARGSDGRARLVNLSVRNQVGVGERILIVGFVLEGTGPSRVLLRAVGPGLTQFGVRDVLARPVMSVYSGQTVLRSNAGWSGGVLSHDLQAAAKLGGAFPLQPGSLDSALVLTLNPGSYTVQIAGAGNSTGEALAEIYLLP